MSRNVDLPPDLRHVDAPIRDVLLGRRRGHRQRVERLFGEAGGSVECARRSAARHGAPDRPGTPRLGQRIRYRTHGDRGHDDDYPEAPLRYAYGVHHNSRFVHLFFSWSLMKAIAKRYEDEILFPVAQMSVHDVLTFETASEKCGHPPERYSCKNA